MYCSRIELGYLRAISRRLTAWTLAGFKPIRLTMEIFLPRRPVFEPGYGKWDLWWPKWRWGKFSPSTSVSPASLHSTKFSITTITRGSDNRPTVADVPSGPSMDSTPTMRIKKNYYGNYSKLSNCNLRKRIQVPFTCNFWNFWKVLMGLFESYACSNMKLKKDEIDCKKGTF
jgi:hypothetical protein